MKDSVDYKGKYLAMRQKLISSVDAAYRMGYSDGAKKAQLDAMAQQAQQQMQQGQQMMQQAQEQQAQMQQQQQPQDPNQEQMAQEAQQQQDQQQMQQQDQGPTEMDQHIAELESIVNKSEGFDVSELMKSIDRLKSSQKAQKPFSVSFTHNMSENSKRDLSMQEKIVGDIFKKWESEEQKTQSEIGTILGVEGLLAKKEK